MRQIDLKTMGYFLIGLAILLIVVLTFVKINFDKQAVFLCQEIENDPHKEMSQCPAHNSSLPWFVMGAFAISFLILSGGLYLLFSGQPENKHAPLYSKGVDVSGLDENERSIYNLLKENKGSMYQSDLVKKTDFTKVQMTRILDKMESDDVLERKRRGMANIVVLK